ncbi:MAG: UPF0280 family protein [Sedimentitalea sp.]
MRSRAMAKTMPDGRLHLQHGPIDLVIDAQGPARSAALIGARKRFDQVLNELVAELPLLRRAMPSAPPRGPIAHRMWRAAAPFQTSLVTPMAAVAGAVADDILKHMRAAGPLSRAVVNNGGDIAMFLKRGEMTGAIAGSQTRLVLGAKDGIGGIATSGWRGRSLSLGIADSVTVLATSAAEADVAATLIANAVDLPEHPKISRRPAHDVQCDSDLGRRCVTVGVGALTPTETRQALHHGVVFARSCLDKGVIAAAFLTLNQHHETVGARAGLTLESELLDA